MRKSNEYAIGQRYKKTTDYRKLAIALECGENPNNACECDEIKKGYKILSNTKLMMLFRDYDEKTGKEKEVELVFDYSISGNMLTLKGKTLEGKDITLFLKKK